MKKRILLYSCLFMVLYSQAQQQALYSHVYRNPILLNPAHTGEDSLARSIFLYRNQWMKIQGAPETQVISVDAPLPGNRLGIGGYLYNDVSNIFGRTGAYVASSYLIPINTDHTIRAGLSLGFVRNRILFDRMIADDYTESTLMDIGQARSVADGSFGVHYTFKAFSASIATTQMMQPNITYINEPVFRETSFRLLRNYYGLFRYTFELNSTPLQLQPLVMIRGVQGLPTRWDIGINGLYKNTYFGTIAYRHLYGVTVQAGIKLHESLSFSYAYDVSTTGMHPFGGGGHEVCMGYTFIRRAGKSGAKNAATASDVEDHELRIESLENDVEKLKKEVDELTDRVNKLKGNMEGQQSAIDSMLLKKAQMRKDIDDNKELMNQKLIQLRKLQDMIKDDMPELHEFYEKERVIVRTDSFDIKRWEYYVVVGTYKQLNYGKYLQRVLKRDYDIDTEVSLSDNKQYYIVSTKRVYSRKEAEDEISRINSLIDKDYLNEGTWIYHKRKQ